jgi:voltage-gated potassium channel
MTSGADRRFFISLASGLAVIVAVAGLIVTLAEKELTPAAFGESFYWSVTTVIGQGDASFVTSPAGWVVSWGLGLFGVAIVATITGALVGFVIDFLLKEGQGMGAAGFEGHIVVCGWNPTAKNLIAELQGDDYTTDVVVIAQAEKNPAGPGTYFVKGDPTDAEDLKRAGIEEAAAAIIFPDDGSNEADMRSILAVLAIESLAPKVRTVVEVNNPDNADHVRRADADEVLITARLSSHLLARSALYPGLCDIVTDIVSGGDGSELYRVVLPDDYVNLNVDDLSARLRAKHDATLLGITRNGHTHVNPKSDFLLELGDCAVVVAESLITLEPLTTTTA